MESTVIKNRFARVIVRAPSGQLLAVDNRNVGRNFPGGKVEEGESPEEAATREAFEETGVVVAELKLVHAGHFLTGGILWEGYFFTAGTFEGIPVNKEPEKLAEVGFYDATWLAENASPVFVGSILAEAAVKQFVSGDRCGNE